MTAAGSRKWLAMALLVVLAAWAATITVFAADGCTMCGTGDEEGPGACTIIAVGKGATVDGSIITSQTADCGSCDFTFHLVPAKDHEPGATRKIYYVSQYETYAPTWTRPPQHESKFSGVEIPQVPHTYAYIHGIFGHINEHQLHINESTIGGRPELQNPKALFDISELTMLAMERTTTARDAIRLMGSLAEKYGYSREDPGESLAVADKNEVWIFEVFGAGPLWTPESGKPGAIWAARRVPDDHVAFLPNHSIIGVIDFDDPENFMYSSNAKSYAVDKGWYDPNSGKPFNWSEVYDPRVWASGDPITAANSNVYYGRKWRGLSLVAPSLGLSADAPLHDLPFSVKPDKKLSLQDVFAINRDHYEGTEFDMTKGLIAGPFGNPNRYPRSAKLDGRTYYFGRPLQPYHTDYTSVCQSRSWLPDPVGGVLWLGLGEADTTAFMPFYAGVTSLPESITVGNHWELNRGSARWAFDYVDFHTMFFYLPSLSIVKEAQKYWEGKAIAEQSVVDSVATELYKTDPAKAREYLTRYCELNTQQVVNAWWNLGDDLLVYFNHGYDYRTPGKRGSWNAPQEWVQDVIEADKIQPSP